MKRWREEMTVSELFREGWAEWNKGLVHQIFTQETDPRLRRTPNLYGSGYGDYPYPLMCSLFFWRASPLRLDHTVTNPVASLADMIEKIAGYKNDEASFIFVMLLWALWYARNSLILQGKDLSHDDCFALAMRLTQEYKATKNELAAQRTRGADTHWLRPTNGVFKINTDASIVKSDGSSIRVVIRAHNEEVIKVLSRKYQQ
ncbi:hypothetical protein DH2020_005805 [Rehmannia glutinosa]|uniref:Uncharacterized protein n=1 Tax=Rehmannia glutinosa TaxID=99300 RepID=A0ABR0XHQ4_REHGL